MTDTIPHRPVSTTGPTGVSPGPVRPGAEARPADRGRVRRHAGGPGRVHRCDSDRWRYPVSAAAPVLVTRWRDLPGARKVPAGLLAVLVGGQHAGAIERDGAMWRAGHQARVLGKVTETEHASADEALRAVLRSGFARHLGARATSRVHWSDKARQAAARGGAR